MHYKKSNTEIRNDYLKLLYQVFGAIHQALHRAPCYPESHNLKGLVCEARNDYQSAIASYRLARYAAGIFDEKESKAYLNCISSNLARSLCRVICLLYFCWLVWKAENSLLDAP